MSLISVILGLLIIVGTVTSILYSIGKTPDHLRGYYGFFYGIISVGAFVGGVFLLVSALL